MIVNDPLQVRRLSGAATLGFRAAVPGSISFRGFPDLRSRFLNVHFRICTDSLENLTEGTYGALPFDGVAHM